MSGDRREAVRDRFVINGIDYLDVSPADETKLTVTFIHNLADAASQPMPGHVPVAADFIIRGGERIRPVRIKSAARQGDNQVVIVVDRVGDFSTYTLGFRITDPSDPNAPGTPPGGFDPPLCQVDFRFHVECDTRFDCKAQKICPPEPIVTPRIDYRAKDYPGFVRVMLDRMALIAPNWKERNPADLGVALVETLAYVADTLSYRQDAIATEAYFETARLRTSVRRHARLVDYFVSDGANARAWLCLSVSADFLPGIGAGARVYTQFGTHAPGLIAGTAEVAKEAQRAGAIVFETMADSGPLRSAHMEMPLYNWSDRNACLPAGATHATLEGDFSTLTPGNVLILAEKLGPLTGSPDDADPRKRCAVRLTSVTLSKDLLSGNSVTEIDWHIEDALRFPICVSSEGRLHVSVARGNTVLADHGRSTGAPLDDGNEDLGKVVPKRRFRPRLAQAAVTFSAPYGAAASATRALAPLSRAPVMTVESTDSDGRKLTWSPVKDLLEADVTGNTTAFVLEVETAGEAYLRFGDGEHGMVPPVGASFKANYRVGNGVAGNVARDRLVLIAPRTPTTAPITAVTNPLPATGGTEPETIEHVRASAPWAFRTQQRAVTMDDYRDVVERFPGVQRAAAELRWTGSWYTAFVTVERRDATAVDARFKDALRAYLDAYRLAGYDLEVEDARRVPLLIEMHACVDPTYVAADVERVLRDVFSARALPDGTKGVFHPDNFNLGGTIYVSPLYACAQAVDGVQSVTVIRFERLDAPDNTGLKQGFLRPGRFELLELSDDPNFPERGQFILHVDGGQ